jgi:dienelactone hydrolase
VTIVTADGVAIAGTWYPSPAGSAPMVLLLHMPTRNRSDWEQVASHLAQRGVNALAIDLRGHGESGAGPTAEPGQSEQGVAIRDVQAALAWLKQRPEALPGRLGIVGASLGANLAVVAAAGDPAVRAIALLSATLDFRGVRSEAALRQYGDRPALLIASNEDGYATRSARELALVGTGSRDLRVLDGAGHGTVMLTRRPDLVSTLVDWLCARLL